MFERFLPLLSLGFLAACSDVEAEAERLRADGRRALEAVGERVDARRADWEEALEREMEDLAAEVDELRSELEREGQLRLQEWEEKLEAQRGVARAKLEELRAAGEESWEQIRDEAVAEAARLAEALEEALGRR